MTTAAGQRRTTTAAVECRAAGRGGKWGQEWRGMRHRHGGGRGGGGGLRRQRRWLQWVGHAAMVSRTCCRGCRRVKGTLFYPNTGRSREDRATISPPHSPRLCHGREASSLPSLRLPPLSLNGAPTGPPASDPPQAPAPPRPNQTRRSRCWPTAQRSSAAAAEPMSRWLVCPSP